MFGILIFGGKRIFVNLIIGYLFVMYRWGLSGGLGGGVRFCWIVSVYICGIIIVFFFDVFFNVKCFGVVFKFNKIKIKY